MHVTIKDVAKRAGVSPSTVSRVIADNPKISDATKERVFEAMKEMDYKPNIIARGLANRRTYTLGMILPHKDERIFDNPFFIKAMRGLSIYAQEKGYFIMYHYCQSEEEELNTIEQFVHSKWVDGIILTTTRFEDKNVEFLFEKKHPFVVIGTPEAHREQILYVDNDNVKAMENVVEHLIKEGHRKIAFVGGEYEFTVNRHRLRGYKRALKNHGIEVDERLILKEATTEKKAKIEMMNIIKGVIPDAIVGVDDVMADGALQGVIESGHERVAVAGFNNTPLAIYKQPMMSSVVVNSEQLGHMAAKLLIDKIENKKLESNKQIIDAKFIERASTLDYRIK